MKLSLAKRQSQYHQLDKARLKQETEPVNAVLQMQPLSEEKCLKAIALFLEEEQPRKLPGNNSEGKKIVKILASPYRTLKIYIS